MVEATVVDVAAKVGHMAGIIFPPKTIPNNVDELTLIPLQALTTLLATDFSAETQPAVHPS